MSTPTDMPWAVATVRRDLCVKCPTPCALQHHASHYSAPCSTCPLPRPRWGRRGGCTPSSPPAQPAANGAPIAVPEPTVAELAENFGRAVARWSEAGFPVVAAELYAARSAACEACPLWDGSARMGLGKCKAPGCGCTKFKRWLATEQCPLGKWPAPSPHGSQ